MITPANSLSISQALLQAVSAIAANCDGAHTKDNIGFNGTHAKFGARLAEIPASEWSADMQADAYAMLATYKTQLKLYGIDYASLPSPDYEANGSGYADARQISYQRSHSPYVEFKGSLVKVWNSYPVKDALKAAGYGVFTFGRNGTKTWDAELTPLVASTILGIDAIALEDDQRSMLQIEADKETPEIEATPKAGVVNIQISDKPGKLKLVTEWGQIPLPVIRMIPGRKWDGPGKFNYVNTHIALLDLAERYNLSISDEARELIEGVRAEQEIQQEKERASIADSIAIDTTDTDMAIAEHLYPFQRAGVSYARKHLSATLIGDEPGLGKTRQALATAESENCYPLLVVCPPSAKFVWLRELIELLPNRTAAVYFGRPKADEQINMTEDILIMGYPSVEAYFPHLPELGGMVGDESHYIKNPKALRTRAIMQIMGKAKDKQGYALPGKLRPVKPMRMFLTGTPVLNRPQELVAPLLALGILTERPGQANSVGKFLYTFCDPQDGFRGHKTFKGLTPGMGEELNNWLRRECMVRRTKLQVLKELPPKTRAPQFIQLNDSARAHYERMEEIAAEKAEESSAAALVEMNSLRKSIGQVILPTAIEWITDFIEENTASVDENTGEVIPGKSLIVFATHKDTQHGLIVALKEYDANLKPQDEGNRINVTAILGGQSVHKTEEQKEIFQDHKSRVIVMSFDSAREAHTLTAASDVLFVQLGWNPGTHSQAEDRAHRIGQELPVTAWYLVPMDTISEWLYELIESKRVVVDAVTDGVMADDPEETIFAQLMDKLERKHGTSRKW